MLSVLCKGLGRYASMSLWFVVSQKGKTERIGWEGKTKLSPILTLRGMSSASVNAWETHGMVEECVMISDVEAQTTQRASNSWFDEISQKPRQ